MIFKVYLNAFANSKLRLVDVPEEELNGKKGNDLDAIFINGQNEVQPQELPSVSMGDVIAYNDRFYMVMAFGFKRVKKRTDRLDFQKLINENNKKAKDGKTRIR